MPTKHLYFTNGDYITGEILMTPEVEVIRNTIIHLNIYIIILLIKSIFCSSFRSVLAPKERSKATDCFQRLLPQEKDEENLRKDRMDKIANHSKHLE